VIAQGSCRRPGASGEDASNKFDEWLAKTAGDAFKRPASLILTGDQIYADDVAVPLFEAVHKIAKDVFGYVEQMPNASGGGVTSVDRYSWKNTVPVPGVGAGSRAPETDLWSGRKKLTHRRTSPFHFTTDDGEAHLLSFPEYAAMYLAVWNPEICKSYGVDDGSDKNLKGFDRAVKAFRRVLANTATYMLCDDHEITDDWNLDQEWEDATKKNPMARRIIANGLAAYWGFQAWGNDPDMFDKNFVQVLSLYFEQLRSSGGYPRNVGSRRVTPEHALVIHGPLESPGALRRHAHAPGNPDRENCHLERPACLALHGELIKEAQLSQRRHIAAGSTHTVPAPSQHDVHPTLRIQLAGSALRGGI
jgi:hypothetical protein